MKAYQISRSEDAPSEYAGDLRAVRAALRVVPASGRMWVRVRLVAVATDKAACIALLNGAAPDLAVCRRWRLSPRGRLIEMALDAADG